MCYSEFNDIIDAIGAMDADVISIETSRSKMELLDAFKTAPLLDAYDIYQHLMDYWTETMQDDVYLIGRRRLEG